MRAIIVWLKKKHVSVNFCETPPISVKLHNINFTLLVQLFLSFYIRTRLTEMANLINIYNFFLDGYYKDNEFWNNG